MTRLSMYEICSLLVAAHRRGESMTVNAMILALMTFFPTDEEMNKTPYARVEPFPSCPSST